MGVNMGEINVAVIVGSNRQDSINRKLAHALVKLGEGKLAARLVKIDGLPMYNQDHEAPLPANVQRFKSEVEEAGAVLFVTPEHNRSIPAVLKNAIDWGARPYGHNSWAGKPTAITGTSPGAIGAAIAQQHLRQILGNLGSLVMGGEAYLAYKPGLIDDGNNIGDESTRQFLQTFIGQFAALANRLTKPATAGRAA
jgi:chromate reductase, NAD(P)H dehydrogenase (quinone)